MISIVEDQGEFTDWSGLLELIRISFAYMDARVDPPSSYLQLDVNSLAQKAGEEILLLARDCEYVTGCCFLKPQTNTMYLGKLAVHPEYQGRNIGRQLIQHSIDLTRKHKLRSITLQTRIELTGNHATFAAMGFRKTGESTHDGFEHPTTISMQLDV